MLGRALCIFARSHCHGLEISELRAQVLTAADEKGCFPHHQDDVRVNAVPHPLNIAIFAEAVQCNAESPNGDSDLITLPTMVKMFCLAFLCLCCEAFLPGTPELGSFIVFAGFDAGRRFPLCWFAANLINRRFASPGRQSRIYNTRTAIQDIADISTPISMMNRNRIGVHHPSVCMSSRRDACFAVFSIPVFTPLASVAAIWDKENVTALFEGDLIVQPHFDPNAREDVAYPDWLEGQWKCSSEMTGFSAPLGARFLGKPNPLPWKLIPTPCSWN